ncbi:MAG: DUF4230 domain-containing protein [Firmicutes bacterium]|nr:DUF4230 domain-containing protein [Bacillota bacterium]
MSQTNKLILAVMSTLLAVIVLLVVLTSVTSLTIGFADAETAEFTPIFEAPPEPPPPPEFPVDNVTAYIRSIVESLQLPYNYRNVIVFSEQSTMTLFGVELGIPGTTQSFVAAYHGEMLLGIDVNQVAVSAENNLLTITLPAAQILHHNIDTDNIEVLDESSGLFTSVSVEDYASPVLAQMGDNEATVLEGSMLTDIRANAETVIRGLLEVLEITEEYVILFN